MVENFELYASRMYQKERFFDLYGSKSKINNYIFLSNKKNRNRGKLEDFLEIDDTIEVEDCGRKCGSPDCKRLKWYKKILSRQNYIIYDILWLFQNFMTFSLFLWPKPKF